ncbi:MAG TPA: translation elongation factor Ts [Clostridia bacterium]|nr:translation elongation factor Ts [Clostridia bacterium]
MAFSSQDVMTLRQITGVGMMDCKKALIATDGDMDKAVDFLREKGMATAAKKAGRIASEGIVYVTVAGNCGVIVEVNCESDFVAKSEGFQAYAQEVATYIAENDVKSVEELIETMTARTNEAISRIGEKIVIRRFEKINSDGKIDSYIHMGGKIGVLVEASAGTTDEIIHDIALQIAAAKPAYISKEDVPQSDIDKEKEILKAQALNEENPKPIAIIEKMTEGRIKKFYKEICLLEQDFVKNSDFTISKYLHDNGNAVISKFIRYEMGEGLQKKENNFAQEIMDQVAAMNK